MGSTGGRKDGLWRTRWLLAGAVAILSWSMPAVSADVQPGPSPVAFQYTESRSPPTLSRGVAPGLFKPSTIVWLSGDVVLIQASNVAAPVDTEALQLPPTLAQPLVLGK